MKNTQRHLIGALTLAVFGLACQDPVVSPPASLAGPTALDVVTGGEVCLDVDSEDFEPVFRRCEEDEQAAIGLIVNEHTDTLAFAQLGRSQPRLANLTTRSPGVTHLNVGRLPVDVSAGADGTVAYTLNQIDGDISIVNLWGPTHLAERIPLSDTPIAFDVDPISGSIVTATGSPSKLVKTDGATCSAENACTLPSENRAILELEGTVTDVVASSDGRAFVVYRDLDVITIVDIATFAVVDHVKVAFGCSDGIDNDEDGLIDQADPQCYGPSGSEGFQDAGRSLLLECADGEDNDGDGLIDRDDPDCISPSSSESGGPPGFTSACSDGSDNDGDGPADYPNDSDCYGSQGRSETTIPSRGFDAIDVDELSQFAYAVDRARGQVIVFDATRNIVIDAAAAAEPSAEAFTSGIGIPVFLTPLDVAGTIRRDCLDKTNTLNRCSQAFFDGYDDEDVIVRYEYGAFVTEDTGRVRYVATMDSYCSVSTEDAREFVDSDFVYAGQELVDSPESNCIFVPQFPLEPREDAIGDCEAPCGDSCDEGLLATRFFCNEGVSSVINPRFSLQDVNGTSSRFTRGNCDIPNEITQAMNSFATFPGAPRNVRCDSPLLPQPLSLDAIDLDPNDFPVVSDLARADILKYQAIFRIWGADDEATELQSVETNLDERVISETWSVEYEGPLPATRRTDGVFDLVTDDVGDQEAVRLNVQGLDLCDAGARVGDRLRVNTSANEDCNGFTSEFEDFQTYEIVRLEANQLWVTTIDETVEGTDRYVQTLPTRNCFPEGTSYEIRPVDQWIVVGDRSGYVSDRESRSGVCVPILGSEETLDTSSQVRSSRVKTGDVYIGPYFSFWLYPGPNAREGGQTVDDELAIRPVQGLKFDFNSNSNFRSRAYQTEGIFPARVDVFHSGGYYRVISSDPNANFVFYKNARSVTNVGGRIR